MGSTETPRQAVERAVRCAESGLVREAARALAHLPPSASQHPAAIFTANIEARLQSYKHAAAIPGPLPLELNARTDTAASLINRLFDDLDIESPDQLSASTVTASSAPSELKGRVFGFGSNKNFTLGLPHEIETETAHRLPRFLDQGQPLESPSIVQVSTNQFHSLLLTPRGELFTCGYGRGARLGVAGADTCVMPTRIPALRDVPCAKIATARSHSLVLTTRGHVFTFGQNSVGQLGLPETTKVAEEPVPIEVPGSAAISSIACSDVHSVLASASGQIFVFGENNGQLGLKQGPKIVHSPTQVTVLRSLTPLRGIAALPDRTLFLTTTGKMFMFQEFSSHSVEPPELQLDNLADWSAVAAVAAIKPAHTTFALLSTAKGLFLQNERAWLQLELSSASQRICVLDFAVSVDIKGSVKAFVCSEEGLVFEAATTLQHLSTARSTPATRVFRLHQIYQLACDPGLDHCLAIQFDLRSLCPTLPAPKSRTESPPANVSEPSDSGTIPNEDNLQDCLFQLSADDMRREEHADVVLLCVDGQRVCAHRVVLAHRSPFFRRELSSEQFPGSAQHSVELPEFADMSSVRNCVIHLYSGTVTHILDDLLAEVRLYDEMDYRRRLALKAALERAAGLRRLAEYFELPDLACWLGLALEASLEPVAPGVLLPLSTAPLPVPDSEPSAPLSGVASEPGFVVIEAGSARVRCHKWLLVARSQYCAAQLSMRWQDPSDDEPEVISLPLADSAHMPTALTASLQFLYTDSLAPAARAPLLSQECCCLLIGLADFLLLPKLKHLTELELNRHVGLRSLAPIANSAVLFRADGTRDFCVGFALKYLDVLFEENQLSAFDEEILELIERGYQHAYCRPAIVSSSHPTAPSSAEASSQAAASDPRQTPPTKELRNRKQNKAKCSKSELPVPASPSSADESDSMFRMDEELAGSRQPSLQKSSPEQSPSAENKARVEAQPAASPGCSELQSSLPDSDSTTSAAASAAASRKPKKTFRKLDLSDPAAQPQPTVSSSPSKPALSPSVTATKPWGTTPPQPHSAAAGSRQIQSPTASTPPGKSWGTVSPSPKSGLAEIMQAEAVRLASPSASALPKAPASSRQPVQTKGINFPQKAPSASRVSGAPSSIPSKTLTSSPAVSEPMSRTPSKPWVAATTQSTPPKLSLAEVQASELAAKRKAAKPAKSVLCIQIQEQAEREIAALYGYETQLGEEIAYVCTKKHG
eukprot:m.914048 g.914048  ORF g.914048 m.914048 type:complete len:1221 (+) comp60138_c0_seq1:124-3786(+)